ncbi:penicillin acylase family protein [Amycolatopsis nalaikhensis]|uniref:Penicillin acylase family protein n=1 Tax=Amycolatopsis nalaikhensis TaxID=715472 RepID=A0ABY8X9B6_9PSEU|nr:penicillin acylase family protein [Amycolatopsis sp. 2-2]WIV52978.1 penicillin acylase family protein [Amycolatopsis sp. 2-2]
MSRSRVARKTSFARRATVVVLATMTVVPVVAAASPGTADAADHADYCGDQCHDILPGGQAGNLSRKQAIDIALSKLAPPPYEIPHGSDQAARYDSLRKSYPGLTDEKLGEFLNSAAFDVNRTAGIGVGGRPDVTISRDSFGIPHIKSTTREGATFGSGYAAAQDRLFAMDLLRHVAKGSAVQFAGTAVESFQDELWPVIAETEADRRAQLDRLAASGDEGKQVVGDLDSFVAGINKYIDEVLHSPLRQDVPVEYSGKDVLQGKLDPSSLLNAVMPSVTPFTTTDVVALITLLGGQFGAAGGEQALAAATKVAAERKYGPQLGDQVWDSLRAANDPETTVTQRGAAKPPYGISPKNPKHVAMPDPGSMTSEPFKPGASSASNAGSQAEAATRPSNFLGRDKGMSNALVVSGVHTKSGNPIAVFGPQTAYFAPEILMLQEIQGPGLSARGAMFPGTGPYVLIGRGPDYAWSATSAHQSIIDTYAVKLCNADGSPAGKESNSYLDNGQCAPMEPLTSPDNLHVWRTKYGIVKQRATVGGEPVAYTELRSTYVNELQSAVGFKRFNDPEAIKGPEDFQTAASTIGFTFNWFYVDSKHTAYYNSGLEPVRAADVDPNLPMWAGPETSWRNWDPATNLGEGVPAEHHPGSIDQDYYVNWNNKSAEDQVNGDFGDGSVHRADLLDKRVKDLISNGNKIDRAALVKAMADAAITDLRGEKILPNLLKVIDSAPDRIDPVLRQGLSDLRRWLDRGTKRTTGPESSTYLDANAVKIMDAWWPLLVKAIFQPVMGDELYDAAVQNLQIDEAPSAPLPGTSTAPHRGSAFQLGWWSYVDKDLRSTLGQQVNGPLPTGFCGTLEKCQSTLLTTLKEAIGKPAAEVYPADGNCAAGDAACADSIRFTPLGVVKVPDIGWQNRPTYQQVVEFPKHR